MIFIRPDGWDGMKDLEVRVGPNGDATNFTTNPLCGAAFPGPAVKDKVSILKLLLLRLFRKARPFCNWLQFSKRSSFVELSP